MHLDMHFQKHADSQTSQRGRKIGSTRGPRCQPTKCHHMLQAIRSSSGVQAGVQVSWSQPLLSHPGSCSTQVTKKDSAFHSHRCLPFNPENGEEMHATSTSKRQVDRIAPPKGFVVQPSETQNQTQRPADPIPFVATFFSSLGRHSRSGLWRARRLTFSLSFTIFTSSLSSLSPYSPC